MLVVLVLGCERICPRTRQNYRAQADRRSYEVTEPREAKAAGCGWDRAQVTSLPFRFFHLSVPFFGFISRNHD